MKRTKTTLRNYLDDNYQKYEYKDGQLTFNVDTVALYNGVAYGTYINVDVHRHKENCKECLVPHYLINEFPLPQFKRGLFTDEVSLSVDIETDVLYRKPDFSDQDTFSVLTNHREFSDKRNPEQKGPSTHLANRWIRVTNIQDKTFLKHFDHYEFGNDAVIKVTISPSDQNIIRNIEKGVIQDISINNEITVPMAGEG